MTLKPQLPSIDQQVADLLRRVGILEALSPANALIITDGSVTVDPTNEIDVDPKSITLTDLGGGIAEIAAGVLGTYTPVLTSVGGNPTGLYVTNAEYVRVGPLVYVNGDITFGATFNPGAGTQWEISLPFATAVLYGPIGTAILRGFGHDDMMVFECNPNNVASPPAFSLQYPAVWPRGAESSFSGSSGWPSWNGDVLGFNVVYYTNA